MKVIVTGADGYLGRGVVQLLLEQGNQVVAMGLVSTGIEHENLTEYVGNIFEEGIPEHEADADVLIHMAWRNGFKHNDISHLEDLPLHYTFLKNAMVQGVKRIAVMGSMHEVGYHEGAIDENTACNPLTPYGVAKNALRQLTVELGRENNVPVQWLRGFYIISNDGRGDSIFAKIYKAEQEKSPTFPFTSGKNKFDFLSYEEFCRMVVAAISQDQINGIINICSGEPVALGECIESFLKDNDFSIKLEYGKYPDRPYDSPAVWGDNTKIRQILRLSED